MRNEPRRVWAAGYLVLSSCLLIAGCTWFGNLTVRAPGTDISFEYVLRFSGEAEKNDALPLLVALHGNGDTPQNFFETALDLLDVPARIVLLKAPIAMGVNGGSWPLDRDGVRRYGEALAAVIEVLAETYPAIGDPVVFGFSGGAGLAYYLAAVYPDRFACIVPVSGRLTPGMVEDRPPAGVPRTDVFAFHGRRDQVIGIGGAYGARDILQARGVRMHLEEFEGGHLGVFTNAKSRITERLSENLTRS